MAAGRPTALTDTLDVVDLDDNGNRAFRTVTVHDRICEQVEVTGLTAPLAAAALGLSRSTVDAWLREARAILPRYDRGTPLLAREQRLIEFLFDTQAAFGRYVLAQNTLHEQIARGGIQTTETHTRTNATGQTIERRTVVKTTLPDAAAIRWNLERKARAEGFGQHLEVTGAKGGPIEISTHDRVRSIIDDIDAYEAGMIDGGDAEREAAQRAEQPGG